MPLNPAFLKMMKKPSTRTRVNTGRMTEAELRREYTKQSKVANKRINAINKAGYYSPAVNNLNKKGISKFGLKNQNLNDPKDIRTAYRELMDFLDSTTSTRTGIRDTANKVSQNFNIPIDNGDYSGFTKKTRKLFDLYDDLSNLSQKGELQTTDKYDIVSDLNALYEQGLIDENTTADELIEQLNQMAVTRDEQYRIRQSQLHFNWNV